jgi:hypothetical protein
MSSGNIHFPAKPEPIIWRWRATGGWLLITDPDRKRYKIGLETFFGVTPDTLERARWKQTRCCEVTPGKVKKYIQEKILGA